MEAMSLVAERAHARWTRSEGFADLSGLLLLGLLVTWTFVTAAGRSEPTSPDPVWQLAIAAAAAYAAGRAGALRHPSSLRLPSRPRRSPGSS